MKSFKQFKQHLTEFNESKEDALVEEHLLSEGAPQLSLAPSVSKVIFGYSGTINYGGIDKRPKNEFRLNIPITTKFYKEVIKKAMKDQGEVDGTWMGYHVTDETHISNMIKLQNKRKTISTFTSMQHNMIDNGVAGSKGGVVFMLAGDALVRGKGDVESLPDKGGRRWINLETVAQMDPVVGKKLKSVFAKKTKGILDSAVAKTKTKMMDILIKDDPQYETMHWTHALDLISPQELDWKKNGSKNAFGRWMFVHDMLHEGKTWKGSDGRILKIPQNLIGKCKAAAIKAYMDAIWEVMKYSWMHDDISSAFGAVLVKYIGNKYIDQEMDGSIDVPDNDEILMNNFLILRMYYNMNLDDKTQSLLDKHDIPTRQFFSGDSLVNQITNMGGFMQGDTKEQLQKDYKD
jgi:hypothetical protein